LDFVFRSVVERVVHNRSLFLERILGVDGVGTSSGKTAANNCGDDNTNENSSSDCSGDGSGAGEKVGANLSVVATSVVCAFVLIASFVTGASVRIVNSAGDARFTWGAFGVTIIVVHACFGVLANFGQVFATCSGIARIIGTVVTVITVNRSGYAGTIETGVNCASVEIVANNRDNLTTLEWNATLRAAFVSGWAGLG